MELVAKEYGGSWVSIGDPTFASLPYLDFIPLRGELDIVDGSALRISLLQSKVLTVDMMWASWDNIKLDAAEMLPYGIMGIQAEFPNLRGVVGINKKDNLGIRFLYDPTDTTPEQALYKLDRLERGELPQAVVGAALAASKIDLGYPFAYTVPEVIGTLCSHNMGIVTDSHTRKLKRKELKQHVDNAIHTLLNHEKEFVVPVNNIDLARFWLLLARELWRPWVRTRLAEGLDLDKMDWILSLAFFHRIAQKITSVQVSNGVKLRIPETPESMSLSLWAQVLEFEKSKIPNAALRYLVKNNTLSEGGLFQAPSSDLDDDLAWGLSQALLRDATENGVYVPTGGFTVELPSEYPLQQWGIASLRIWAETRALFVTLINTKGGQEGSFGWRPGERLSSLSWIIPSNAITLVEVTLAALWRDLRVAGETILPPVGTRNRLRREQKTSRSHQRKRKRRKSVRTLPGRRYVRIAGNRQWGNDEERSAIHRQAHGVRGHLRRLRPGWAASGNAATTAEEFGMTIPDGFTFVRPHVRGDGQADDPGSNNEVIIRSRGLASVMTLLGN